MKMNGTECKNTNCPLWGNCKKSSDQWLYALKTGGKCAGKKIAIGSPECVGTWYLGIPGFYRIWHGTQGDPEVVFHGVHVDEVVLIDGLLGVYMEENEDGDEDGFDEWLFENRSLVLEEMENWRAAMESGDIRQNRINYIER